MKIFAAFLCGLVLLPLIGIGIGLSGFWSSRATSNPPSWENTFADRVLRASLARHAPGLSNPVSASEETLRAGMKIFRTNCAGCHGEFGQPSSWGTRGFYPRVPQFAAAPPVLSESEMFFVIKNGIRYTGMGAWDGMLSDTEIWQVAAFLSRLPNLPDPIATEWKSKH